MHSGNHAIAHALPPGQLEPKHQIMINHMLKYELLSPAPFGNLPVVQCFLRGEIRTALDHLFAGSSLWQHISGFMRIPILENHPGAFTKTA
jgi:hypothetical protein